MSKLTIVLDTNVLLVSLSSKSSYHWIFRSLIDGQYNLLISNDILTEYFEIITNKFSKEAAAYAVKTLLLLDNVIMVETYFNWNLINADPDDNKFVDCAVAGNANAIVSHDKHFKILDTINFPAIAVYNTQQFSQSLGFDD